jgi:hypothetical protein
MSQTVAVEASSGLSTLHLYNCTAAQEFRSSLQLMYISYGSVQLPTTYI